MEKYRKCWGSCMQLVVTSRFCGCHGDTAQLRKRVTCILETSQEATRTIRTSETEASVLLFLIRLCLTLHFSFLQQDRQAYLAYPCLPQIIPSSCFFWWAIGGLEHAALMPCFLSSYCCQNISCTYRQNFVFTQFINARNL